MDYKWLGQTLAQAVKADLVAYFRQTELVGETLINLDDLKSTHCTAEVATAGLCKK